VFWWSPLPRAALRLPWVILFNPFGVSSANKARIFRMNLIYQLFAVIENFFLLPQKPPYIMHTNHAIAKNIIDGI
jgi:hypothetical protein